MHEINPVPNTAARDTLTYPANECHIRFLRGTGFSVSPNSNIEATAANDNWNPTEYNAIGSIIITINAAQQRELNPLFIR